MKIVEQSYKILHITENPIQLIEEIARTCYKSEAMITADSAEKMVRSLIKKGHEAMIEHASMTVKFITCRGVSHEIVRHRLCAFAQESTRYCCYNKDKFGNEITVINPGNLMNEGALEVWKKACEKDEMDYIRMTENGTLAQMAREILPNALKTEIVVTANMREWRHIFKLRTAKAAHPQMRQLMIPLLKEMKENLPALFEDITIEE